MQSTGIRYCFLIGLLLAGCGTPTAQPSAAPLATPSAPHQQATEVAPSVSTAAAGQPTSAVVTSTSLSEVAERALSLQEPRLQGEDVRAVQQRLLDLGYTQVGLVDGIFGPQTEAAVRAFQHTNRLQVDGVVGPETRTRLVSLEATAAVVPIVVHTSSAYLLGGVQAQNWLPAPAVAPLLTGGERYRVVSGNAETTAIGSTAVQLEPICSDAYIVSLEPAVWGDAAVAVGGDWQLQPRTPREVSANDPSLQQAVAAFLQTKAIEQPSVQIERAVQIDLDGDGSDELVVNANHLTTLDPTDVAAGDYSFVAVQKTVNGAPSLVELAGNYFPQAGDFVAPYEYRVLGILDLNGDRVLEVVVNGAYYEGASTSAFQVQDTSARVLLATGCGV
jgi:peptidoglycan hydrolase-like protein with peptidoglycan-binding domain